jgi:hypothetical protein
LPLSIELCFANNQTFPFFKSEIIGVKMAIAFLNHNSRVKSSPGCKLNDSMMIVNNNGRETKICGMRV